MSRYWLGAVIVLCIEPQVLFARAYEVRLLSGSEHNGVWGTEEYQVHVFVLKLMDGIRVVPRRELADLGIVL